MHQHRPHHRGAGSIARRCRGAAALAVLLASLVLVACGDGNGSGDTVPGDFGNDEAAALLPDLSDVGYRVLIAEDVPLTENGARALYELPDTHERRVIVIAFTSANTADAETLYGNVAEAYRVMPLAALLANPLAFESAEGQPPVNTEIDGGPGAGDAATWFRTAQSDDFGTNVWTDVYRVGTTVAVVQVLDRDEAHAAEIREEAARRLEARVG